MRVINTVCLLRSDLLPPEPTRSFLPRYLQMLTAMKDGLIFTAVIL